MIHAAEGNLANDNDTIVEFTPPEGFRKVSIGWRSTQVFLFCVTCGVAAQADPNEPSRLS